MMSIMILYVRAVQLCWQGPAPVSSYSAIASCMQHAGGGGGGRRGRRWPCGVDSAEAGRPPPPRGGAAATTEAELSMDAPSARGATSSYRCVRPDLVPVGTMAVEHAILAAHDVALVPEELRRHSPRPTAAHEAATRCRYMSGTPPCPGSQPRNAHMMKATFVHGVHSPSSFCSE